MKFRKNLAQVVAVSDPLWDPFWINYKYLKKIIVKIEKEMIHNQNGDLVPPTSREEMYKSAGEVEFFRLLQNEVKKTSEFFNSEEHQCRIRKANIETGFKHKHFFRFQTRTAFMRNVINHQNFSHYTGLLQMVKESEELFFDIMNCDSTPTLRCEERLFLDAIRDLNFQASRLRAEEISTLFSSVQEAENMARSVKYDIISCPPHDTSFPPHDTSSRAKDGKHNDLSPQEGLDAASDVLVDIARATYVPSLQATYHPPNIRSAVKWIQRMSRVPGSGEAPEESEMDDVDVDVEVEADGNTDGDNDIGNDK
eukprot:gene4516-8971_t